MRVGSCSMCGRLSGGSMQRPENDLEEVYEAIPPPCGSHESTCRVVGRIDFLRYANPQCNASLRRLSERKLFQFEGRQIAR